MFKDVIIEQPSIATVVQFFYSFGGQFVANLNSLIIINSSPSKEYNINFCNIDCWDWIFRLGHYNKIKKSNTLL